MIINRTKNYKGFTAVKEFWFSIFLMLTLSFSVSAEQEDNQLTGISYNTIQADQIELIFSFSDSIGTLPEVKTSMTPAFVEVSFEAKTFSEKLKKTLINHAGVKDVKLNTLTGQVVAKINLETLAVFDVAVKDKDFSITFNYGDSADVVESLSPAGEDFINNVNAIDFRLNEDNDAQILVYLDNSSLAVDVHDKLGKVNVEFHNTNINEELLYQLDVTDFGTIVTGIETFKEGRSTRLVVESSEASTFTYVQDEQLLILTVKKMPEKVPSYLGDAEDFNGRNIALNFQDIPVRTVLQIIADYSNFNLIAGDTVTGNITLRLNGVPWDQALSIILKVKGLDKRMQGNILMVAPSDELAAREAQALQARQEVEELAPLYSEYVQINYAKATELASLIKNEDTSILSPRGSVSVDERTNTLLIRDTATSIEDIKRMLVILDIPVRQVVIEARMVTVQDNLNEELGIRWGVSNTDGEYATSGTIEGASKLNGTRTTAGGDYTGKGEIPSTTDGMNVNLPVTGAAGTIAFQVARLANGTILDLELSALEKENKGEIIASPRITTANQKQAFIEQGVEIPYQESAGISGATTTQFKKAVLSLTVTPHITPDDKIILDLNITQDTVSEVKNGLAPAIDTQRIGTQVLVDNGETIVLGGIYQQAIISSVTKVPVLGDIPYFGWAFRTTSESNQKKELLIFVTPRIVTEHF